MRCGAADLSILMGGWTEGVGLRGIGAVNGEWKIREAGIIVGNNNQG